MVKAYVYGSEVQILDYHLARMHGTRYCKVRYIKEGWVSNVPESCIDIVRCGAY